MDRKTWVIGIWALAALVFCASALAGSGKRSYRGYTIMAGALGSKPTRMWGNTEANHLAFVKQARINLVVVEVPYGVGKGHPASQRVTRFIRKLRAMKAEVWIIYPHVLAQTFDLPRQVDSDGKTISWNCCFNHPRVQDWLIDNGRSIVKAYRPDGLVLFGTFHVGVGGKCLCTWCKTNKVDSGARMDQFFARWRKAVRTISPRIKLGSCSFWARVSKRTLAALDMVCPVVGIWRPGYAGPGQIKRSAGQLLRKFKGKLRVPYIKLFLASQTNSTTQDVLTAARESTELADGFFFWGYNPGHSHERQTYDHPLIWRQLRALAGRR